MITLPAGNYKPGSTFDADGRRWYIQSVAHTGQSLRANAYGYPWRDETFAIERSKHAMIIREYTVQLQTYHDEIIGRLCFNHPDHGLQESGLYSIVELNNIVALWQDDSLLGSFGIGTVLSRDARCTLTLKSE